jgi:hypothetical protein
MHLVAQYFELPGLPLHSYLSVRDLLQCMCRSPGNSGGRSSHAGKLRLTPITVLVQRIFAIEIGRTLAEKSRY